MSKPLPQAVKDSKVQFNSSKWDCQSISGSLVWLNRMWGMLYILFYCCCELALGFSAVCFWKSEGYNKKGGHLLTIAVFST